MSKKYAWMRWGGGEAHGLFDSYGAALADAKKHFAGERAEITINAVCYVDFFNHAPDADQLVEEASVNFDDNHGWDGSDAAFDLAGANEEATAELHAALAEWARKWIVRNIDWYVTENEKIVLEG